MLLGGGCSNTGSDILYIKNQVWDSDILCIKN